MRGEAGNHDNPRARLKTPAAEASPLVTLDVERAAPPIIVSFPPSIRLPVTRSPHPGSARAAVTELVGLFPRGLFEDALPPIALKSQVYSLVPDRTAADRQLVRVASATDQSHTQILNRSASHSAVQQALDSFCARHCSATNLVKRSSGSRERANFVCRRAKLLGKLDHWVWLELNTAGNTGKMSDYNRPCASIFPFYTELVEHVKQEREPCIG